MLTPNRDSMGNFMLCFYAIPHNAWDGVGSSDHYMHIKDILYISH